MHTARTPSRSSATTRSGIVGPRTTLARAMMPESASIPSAACIIRSSMMDPGSSKELESPPLETLLALGAGGVRILHVHHGHVEEGSIGGDVERHAPRCQVDQRGEEEALSVPGRIERD